jgi:hypothetical protein
MRSFIFGWALLAALPAVALLVSGDASADSATLVNAHLPSARAWTTAGWDGTNAYVFGGIGFDSACGCYAKLDDIVRYTPSTNAMTTMQATLPTPRDGMSVVWTGRYFFLFGGHGASTLDQIVRYDPIADAVSVMNAKLPQPRHGTYAAWDGVNAYVMEGYCDCGQPWIDTIVVYNPTTDSATTRSTFVHGSGGVGVWDGTSAYVLGDYRSRVVRYTPAMDNVTVLGAAFSSGSMSAATDGANAFLFGGYDGQELDQILCYHIGTDTLATKSVTVPM